MKVFPCFAWMLGAALALGADAPQTFLSQAKVVDTNSMPIPGAIVERYRGPDSPASADTSLRFEDRCTADTNGTVAFTATNQIVFMLIASKPGLSLGWGMWYPSADTEESTAEFTLTQPTAVSGEVQDAAAKSVPDAAVWVNLASRHGKRDDNSESWEILSSWLGRQRLATRTGADGRFRIEGLPSDAALELAVAKPGLALDQPHRAYWRPRLYSLSFQAGESNIVLTLKPAGAIEGRVVQENTGAPVADARVLVVEAGFGGDARPPSPTDSDGIFHLTDLSAGEYRLRAVVVTNEFPDWVCDMVSATVETGATNRDVKITASRGAVLEVTVRDESSNQPIKAASVSVYGKTLGQQVRTSDQGFAPMRLVPGDYQLFASKEGQSSYQSQVTLVQNETNRLTVTLGEATRISGTVVDPDGKPAPKAAVTFFPDRAVKQTDAEGHFTLTWDRNQFQFAGFDQRVIVVRDLTRNLAAAVDLEDETTNVILRLEPALTLAGRVTDTNGKAVTNAQAQVTFLTDPVSSQMGSAIRADAEGRFEIKALPLGRRYSVNVSAKGFGRTSRVVEAQETDKRRVELDPFQLALANQRIAGVVVDADDKPVAGAHVNGYGETQPSLNGMTDPKGRFSFDQVCDGPIQLSANSPLGGSYGNTTAEGGDTNITIQLGIMQAVGRPGKTLKLTGTVVDADGKPASKVTVNLFPMPQGEKRTDAVGRFTLTFDPNQSGGMQINQRVVIACDPARNLAAALDVEEDTTNVNLRLEPALTLVGRVTDTSGKAISNAQAQVMFLTDRMGSQMGSAIRTDAEGRFEIKGLPTDRRYSVNVSAKGFGQESRSVDTPEAETRRVELDPFELPVADQRIAGVVLDNNDKPVAHASIYSYGGKQPNLNGQTDAKGRFSFDKVCVGSIQFSANDPSGRGYGNAAAEGGDTNIIIRISASSSTRTQTPRRAALKGKPLPDLATVNLASDAAPTGKPVLLCLFDVEQRPSRRVARLLTEQYDALRQKGVTVLGVQAAVTTAESLQSWKDANPVPFPVGRVAEKSDKTKWASEVESLPWLILTDADHRVTAEGFALDELDEKLKTLTK
jgi:protocatechuate 3,4-dioxygenase beta subunit